MADYILAVQEGGTWKYAYNNDIASALKEYEHEYFLGRQLHHLTPHEYHQVLDAFLIQRIQNVLNIVFPANHYRCIISIGRNHFVFESTHIREIAPLNETQLRIVHSFSQMSLTEAINQEEPFAHEQRDSPLLLLTFILIAGTIASMYSELYGKQN